MDRNKANQILADVRIALAEVAKKHNCVYTPGRGTFDNSMVRGKHEFTEASVVSKIAATMKAPEVGETFVSLGTTYRVTGFRSGRNFTWTIANRVHDGRSFKFRPSTFA